MWRGVIYIEKKFSKKFFRLMFHSFFIDKCFNRNFSKGTWGTPRPLLLVCIFEFWQQSEHLSTPISIFVISTFFGEMWANGSFNQNIYLLFNSICFWLIPAQFLNSLFMLNYNYCNSINSWIMKHSDFVGIFLHKVIVKQGWTIIWSS